MGGGEIKVVLVGARTFNPQPVYGGKSGIGSVSSSEEEGNPSSPTGRSSTGGDKRQMGETLKKRMKRGSEMQARRFAPRKRECFLRKTKSSLL